MLASQLAQFVVMYRKVSFNFIFLCLRHSDKLKFFRLIVLLLMFFHGKSVLRTLSKLKREIGEWDVRGRL